MTIMSVSRHSRCTSKKIIKLNSFDVKNLDILLFLLKNVFELYYRNTDFHFAGKSHCLLQLFIRKYWEFCKSGKLEVPSVLQCELLPTVMSKADVKLFEPCSRSKKRGFREKHTVKARALVENPVRYLCAQYTLYTYTRVINLFFTNVKES